MQIPLCRLQHLWRVILRGRMNRLSSSINRLQFTVALRYQICMKNVHRRE
ncbi:hypothetical protein T11_11134, partial [Trichinella zimbabwensis]